MARKVKLNKEQEKCYKAIQWLLFSKHLSGKTFLLYHITDECKKRKTMNDLKRLADEFHYIAYDY